MARFLFVFVMLLAKNVFANNDDINLNCDVCIRSGRTWCHSNQIEDHCLVISSDDACPDGAIEELTHITNNRDGDLLRPIFAERTLYINDLDYRKMTVTYVSTVKRNVTAHFLNMDTDPKIDVQVQESNCDATTCTVAILAKSSQDFCTYFDFVDVFVKVDGITEEATVRYHVPCSCNCTKNMEVKSHQCNSHGNYTCGICSCDSEWTGRNCEISCTRGDQEQECKNVKHEQLVECSGNGKCACGTCKCFDDREGSQYFDRSEHCADICMQTMECHSCLRNGTQGECLACDNMDTTMKVLARNETLALSERDYMERNVWVHCQEHADECDYDYYAMKTEESFYVMINSNCNNSTAGMIGAAATGSNVPLILGILGLVAVVAAVGGVLLWKHMNALPPMPMSDPQYANIDAEDCTGENPLYKPPTSSFKNPTYGKW